MTPRAFRFTNLDIRSVGAGPGGAPDDGEGGTNGARGDAGRHNGRGQASRGLDVTATGAVAMVDGDDAIRQAILMLLSTTVGERLMRPAYGCQLNRLVFAPNDQTTAGLAIHYVRQAIERWEPRVRIVDLDARPDQLSPALLLVRLRYQVRASLTVAAIDLPVHLDPPHGGGRHDAARAQS
ncbi:GPW/gp25 family protein [Solwaraspora sp. WMMB335]|uniref:GPW/gp25 family protein n=1 Tax=Solwaraspora sp. WMMB335 TaxID=3404118 RepID=UPI003B951255